MKKAGRLLKNWTGNFLHITCLAHLWHRVAENIRNKFDGANLLIANMNKVIFMIARSPLPLMVAIHNQHRIHQKLPIFKIVQT